MKVVIWSLGVVFVALFWAQDSYSQATTDSQLAAHYYQSGEFDKAALYYERLYDRDPSSFNYNYLLKCLEQLTDYEKARKLIKKQQKIDGLNQKVRVDFGRTYLLEGKTKKANKEFDDLVKGVPPSYATVKELSDAFVKSGQDEYALKTLKRGEQVMKGAYPFNLELADAYARLGRYEEMVDEILELLDFNPSYLKTVQAALSRNGSFDSESEQNITLKNRLIKRVNQNPDKVIYSELLIWLYTQESNWDMALLQTKALDRRLKEEGIRVYSLAEVLLNNGQYDQCLDACEYVTNLGMLSPYYIQARILQLEARNRKVTESDFYTSEDVDLLIKDYETTLFELGKSAGTAELMKQKAYMQAFFQHRLDSALDAYEEVLEIAGLDPTLMAETQLEYGDALLAAGYIWDASIQFGLVDKKFKYDRLGEQAKFRSARVHFYTGDFKLAKAQLDILKGATSKLIANDAMLLSVLISDNSTVDTSVKPLKLYADAHLLVFQNKFDEARTKLDSIGADYPGHALEDEVLLLRYEMFKEERNWEEAAAQLELIVSKYVYDVLADKAIFYLAEIKEEQFNDKEGAMELYQTIMLDFKDSLYLTEARKRYRSLRGDELN